MPHEKAREIIVGDKGTHFDPDVVDAFLVHEAEFKMIREEIYQETIINKKYKPQAYTDEPQTYGQRVWAYIESISAHKPVHK